MSEEFIFCTRCGAKLRKNQRNCLKCGQLNYSHPDNQYMKKYISKNDTNNNDSSQQTYVVGKGTMNKKNGSLSIFNNIRPNEVLTDKNGNLTVFAIVNIIIFIFGILLCAFVSGFSFSSVFFNRSFAISLMIYSFVFLEIYSLELLFMKANYPWWAVFVPFLDMYYLYEITMSSGWIFLLTYIPVIGYIISLAASYNLGKVFGYNPLLTLFFGPFVIPFMAFNNTTSFNGIVYVNRTKKNTASEILYKWNKRIFILIVLSICSGIGILGYSYRDSLLFKVNRLRTNSFMKDAEVILNDAKISLTDESNFTCSNGLLLSEQSTYYIPFDNAGTYFNSSVTTSSLSDGYYQGYIKVVNPDEWSYRTKYYISVDDSIYGIEETYEYELDKSYAKKNTFATIPDDVVVCKKNKS